MWTIGMHSSIVCIPSMLCEVVQISCRGMCRHSLPVTQGKLLEVFVAQYLVGLRDRGKRFKCLCTIAKLMLPS